MSKTLKSLCALSLLGLVAACGGNRAPVEEYVVVPEPISVEPAYTGTYK